MRLRGLKCKSGISALLLLAIAGMLFIPLQTPEVKGQSDFSLTASSTYLGRVPVNAQAATSVNVTSLSGFSGSVALSSSYNSTGLTLGSYPASVNISPTNPVAGFSLSVTAKNLGSYTINVTGTSGSTSHLLAVTVDVVGEVCLQDPSKVVFGFDPCPNGPFVFKSSTTGSQVQIGVYVWRSDGLTGFDITLLADHTVLKPSNASLTGTILAGTPLVFLKCVGGRLLTSGGICGPNDTPDTLELAAASPPFSPPLTPPVTALLFTAIYNVTGTTASSGMSIEFQTGCGFTSVAGGVCITVANGTPRPVPETVVEPDFTLSSSAKTIDVFSGLTASTSINLSSLQGFVGATSFSFSVSPTSGLSISVVPPVVELSSGGTNSSMITFSTSAGTYSVNVTGYGNGIYHFVQLTVIGQDYLMVSTTSILGPLNLGVQGSTQITVTSVNGFAGTIVLSVTTSSLNLQCNLSSSNIAGGSGASSLTCTTLADGHYVARVAGLSGSLSHNVNVTLIVEDFLITPNPAGVTVNAGTPGSSTTTVTHVGSFAGTVSLAVATNSTNLTCSLSSTNIAGGSGTSTLSCTGSIAGNYLATVTGTNGVRSANVTLIYEVQDFALTASSSTVSFTTGTSNSSVTVALSPANGFSSSVSLAVSVSPSTGLAASLTPSTLVGSGIASLKLSASSPGTYSVNITAVSGSLVHQQVIRATVSGISSSGTPILPLSTVELYSIIGVVAAIIVIGIFLGLRYRKASH